ncbi:hypothetical protein ZIOFF_072550 [Zingiber officinale]|uniref:Uncharacterized protein n=1 Tax=Zingiber officinale TaxID=94328 RepID=A0A8J5E9L9_ZINOF|nr:hypothetical protein ZIOFF_072550 [Zingiber officinale]
MSPTEANLVVRCEEVEFRVEERPMYSTEAKEPEFREEERPVYSTEAKAGVLRGGTPRVSYISKIGEDMDEYQLDADPLKADAFRKSSVEADLEANYLRLSVRVIPCVDCDIVLMVLEDFFGWVGGSTVILIDIL